MARAGPSLLAKKERFSAVGRITKCAQLHTEDIFDVVVDLQDAKYMTKLRRIPGLWSGTTQVFASYTVNRPCQKPCNTWVE